MTVAQSLASTEGGGDKQGQLEQPGGVFTQDTITSLSLYLNFNLLDLFHHTSCLVSNRKKRIVRPIRETQFSKLYNFK